MSAGRRHLDAVNDPDDAVSCAIRDLEALLANYPQCADAPELREALSRLWGAWRSAREGAQTDSLTQLPNRACFEHAIRLGIEAARAHFSRVVLMFLDLDCFKEVNDRYGHQAGDDLLNTVGQRIVSCVRDEDLVARYGGDEFVVMLEEPCPPPVADQIAARILHAVNQPYAVDDEPLSLSISVGVALFPDHAKTAVDLIRRADLAMYRAKERGGFCYVLYERGFERDLRNGMPQPPATHDFSVLPKPGVGAPKNHSGS